jgi:hypothetical protein
MKPVSFPEKNLTLNAPAGMEDECSSLDIFTDGKQCLSLWSLSFKERLQILLRGKIWLGVLSGHTQPPVWLSSEKTVFEHPEGSE